jgi:hypothetical protein
MERNATFEGVGDKIPGGRVEIGRFIQVFYWWLAFENVIAAVLNLHDDNIVWFVLDLSLAVVCGYVASSKFAERWLW